MVLLEVCVDSLEGLRAAEAKQAGRIEFCAHLEQGGLSPSREVLALALATSRLPIHVMVRPRAGNFVYSPYELDLMQAEIAGLHKSRVAGVVLGVLTPDSRIDLEATSRLAAFARPMSVTFHRAFDEVRDLSRALEDLVRLRIDRVLTSGGAADAVAGRPAIRALVEQARGRIVVMAGGGVRRENVARILADTGVEEVHGSVPFELPSALGNPEAAPNFREG